MYRNENNKLNDENNDSVYIQDFCFDCYAKVKSDPILYTKISISFI